jgi:hypothetical protein
MEEDLATLEDILLCIDTIAKVLRAAHKYQIQKFISYFSHVVAQELTRTGDAPNSGSFFIHRSNARSILRGAI